MNSKVAFIDSNVNIEYINKIKNEGQTISSILTVSDNAVVESNCQVDTLTHATLCIKVFFEYISSNCEIFLISIMDSKSLKANIDSLIVALSWCLDNNIKLINLSIGSTCLVDARQLYLKVNELANKDVIIVSAASNNNKMTFPAFFDNIIGVKSIKSKSPHKGFAFNGDGIDGIEVSCFVENSMVEHNGQYYSIYSSNSFAAPIISAKICNYINDGYVSLEQIKYKLKEDSIKINPKLIMNTRKYFRDKIDIPIIAVMNNMESSEETNSTESFIQKLIVKFLEYGYSGICLSRESETDILKYIINLVNYDKYSYSEKLKYYSHYCDVSYIIVAIEPDIFNKNLKIKDIDIIIYSSKLNEMKYKKGITYIPLFDYKNFDIIFNKIYSYLSAE